MAPFQRGTRNSERGTLRSALRAPSSALEQVLVRGASGTGKELVARALHYISPRRDRRPDIPELVEHFLTTRQLGSTRYRIEPDADWSVYRMAAENWEEPGPSTRAVVREIASDGNEEQTLSRGLEALRLLGLQK